MKVSTFKKELSATGKQGIVKAEVIATMNCKSKTIRGTHPSTHDDYVREVQTHKVEVFVDGKLWKKSDALDSELMVLNESEKWIREANLHITKLSNEEPIKTFGEKMQDLYSRFKQLQKMEKYSKEMFEGFTHRFIVKMKVDNDWRNDTNITIYSNSDSYKKLDDFINEKKSDRVVSFSIEHRASKEQDERSAEFIDEVLNGL